MLLLVLQGVACEKEEPQLGEKEIFRMDSGPADTDLQDIPMFDGGNDGGNRTCAEEEFSIMAVPVRLIILQDVSGSMNSSSKWKQAKNALNTMLTNWQGRGIQFGIDVFPSGTSAGCDVETPIVADCDIGQEQTIINRLDAIGPGGGTPLYCAMANFRYPTYAPKCTASDGGSTYLLLVSDGDDKTDDTCLEACSGSNSIGDSRAHDLGLLAQELFGLGTKTFAIGFGRDTNEVELDEIVLNGGTGEMTYLDAQNEQELETALQQIVATVVSCEYDLSDLGLDVSKDDVNIYFDDEVLYLDHECKNGIGWTWASQEKDKILFCDQACNTMKNAGVISISATFGCPSETVY